MDVKPVFTNIHQAILDLILQADRNIVAAVAWFTDHEIFDLLCKQAAMGIHVSIAVADDYINKGSGGLNFQRLRDIGGEVLFISSGRREETIMHHKFCVIDAKHIITGSYNWSKRARNNDENVTLITDAPDIAQQYLSNYQELVDRSQPNTDKTVDFSHVIRRLEIIRNYILLGDTEDISLHVTKLKSAESAMGLTKLIELLNLGEYQKAIDLIDERIRQSKSIAVHGHAEIPVLRLQLKVLELHLENLSNEKTDIERRLITFNLRHDAALGDLIQELLRLRTELARIFADRAPAEDEHATNKTDKAESQYREYAKQHEYVKQELRENLLDDASEKTLKDLYRRACCLCHPDKVDEALKEKAHQAFVELQDAYRNNDLDAIREIYKSVKNGFKQVFRSSLLTDMEQLRVAIASMEVKISQLTREITAMITSDSYILMKSLDQDEKAFGLYVESQKEILSNEIAGMKNITAGIIKDIA